MECKNHWNLWKIGKSKITSRNWDKRNPQTFLGIVLALRVLNDYDDVLSYQIFNLYKKELRSNPSTTLTELDSLKKRIEMLEAENAKLQNAAIDVNF